MSSDDWPDDSREQSRPPRDPRAEDQEAWYDRPDDGFAPPPSKPGMSTATKLLLIFLGGTGLLFLVCCGGLIYLWTQMDLDFNEDPVIAQRRQQEIVDMTVPESFKPAGSMSFNFFVFSMKMVVYEPVEGEGSLILMNMNVQVEGADPEEEFRRSLRDERQGKELKVDQESIEAREFEIRGETVEFEFAHAKDEDGEEYRQVVGSFPGKEGTVFLMLQVEEDKYNEEQVVQMIESIK